MSVFFVETMDDGRSQMTNEMQHTEKLKTWSPLNGKDFENLRSCNGELSFLENLIIWLHLVDFQLRPIYFLL